MIDVASDVLPTFGLLTLSIVLTAASLWVGGRLTPWFLQETVEAPTLRSFFFSLEADRNFDRVRLTTGALGFAVMLAILLVIAIVARTIGWAPAILA
jgi:hypothetical protein